MNIVKSGMKMSNSATRHKKRIGGGGLVCALTLALSIEAGAFYQGRACVYLKPVPSKDGEVLRLGGNFIKQGKGVPGYAFNLTNMPVWCERAVVSVNDTTQIVTRAPARPIVIPSTTNKADTLGLELTVKPNPDGYYRFFQTRIAVATASGGESNRYIVNYGVTQEYNDEAELVYHPVKNKVAERGEDGSVVTNKGGIVISKYNGTDETFVVPSEIEGVPVVALDEGAFRGNPHLRSVTVPSSVGIIGDLAFADCTNLVSATFVGDFMGFWGRTLRICDVQISDLLQYMTLSRVEGAPSALFARCTNLRTVAFSSRQAMIGPSTFSGCKGLESFAVPRGVSYIGTGAFADCLALQALEIWGEPPDNLAKAGFPEDMRLRYNGVWADEWMGRYAGFTDKFGTDFTTALTAQTGKRDGSGKPLLVWQDLVAGTDPTDEASTFRALISFDAATGKPVIGWTPALPREEAARRTYRKFGKVFLSDPTWTEISDNEADFNFFKVVVDMK